MTKWLDTNYHYLVPELADGQRVPGPPGHWVGAAREARRARHRDAPGRARPVQLPAAVEGPRPAARRAGGARAGLRGAARRARRGGRDARCSSTSRASRSTRTAAELDAAIAALGAPRRRGSRGLPGDLLRAARRGRGRSPGSPGCGLAELHLDLVRGAGAARRPPSRRWPAARRGCRSAWSTAATSGPPTSTARSTPLDAAVGGARRRPRHDRAVLLAAARALRRRRARPASPPEVRGWLAFAAERLDELATLARAVAEPGERDVLLARLARARRLAPRLGAHQRPGRARPHGRARATTTTTAAAPVERAPRGAARAPRPARAADHHDRLVPADATRSARPAGTCAPARSARPTTQRFLEERVAEVVAVQEELGLDVLVHGEPERNDMVEYFGQQLRGFTFSEHGWVQSYGSRCVKPPILYGDVSRPAPMTVRWWRYAQSLTERPMKGMLTGPVTILQWSFVRDDQPRARDLPPDRPRDPGRGARPGAGRRGRDPGRRGRPARGAAAARARTRTSTCAGRWTASA